MRTIDPGTGLFRKTRSLLLGWLLTHPDESFYVRELIRVTGAASGAVPRELETLEKAGIVRRTVRGHQVFYQADETSPIFSELQSIFLKTSGLADQIRTALAPLAPRITAAALYGSAPRGGLRRDSDVDLLVVGDVSFGDVVAALAPTQTRLGREINPSVYSLEEFRLKIRRGHHFLTMLMREPLQFLIGGPHDLERLGKKWLDRTAPAVEKRGIRSHRNRRARPGR